MGANNPNGRINGKTAKKTNVNDFYPTPYEITEDLFKLEKFDGDVLEPACGQGHMSEIISKYNQTFSFDKFDDSYSRIKHDFLTFETDQEFDNIITNPPFTFAEQFVLKAKKIAKKKIAMILKIQFLEGKSRLKNLWKDKEFPLEYVYIYSGRVGFGDVNNKKVSSALCFAWYVWNKEYKGEPKIRWIEEDKKTSSNTDFNKTL